MAQSLKVCTYLQNVNSLRCSKELQTPIPLFNTCQESFHGQSGIKLGLAGLIPCLKKSNSLLVNAAQTGVTWINGFYSFLQQKTNKTEQKWEHLKEATFNVAASAAEASLVGSEAMVLSRAPATNWLSERDKVPEIPPFTWSAVICMLSQVFILTSVKGEWAHRFSVVISDTNLWHKKRNEASGGAVCTEIGGEARVSLLMELFGVNLSAVQLYQSHAVPPPVLLHSHRCYAAICILFTCLITYCRAPDKAECWA